jgi:polysaccharide pyruvyl transferase WcaK-like protein
MLGLEAVLGADCVFSLEGLSEGIPPAPDRDHSRLLLVITGQKQHSLEAVVRKLGKSVCPVALLTTCEVEDGPALRAVSEACGVPVYAPLTWQETVAEMKASALIITNRLHGLILGSFARTPVVPLTDRVKTLAVASDAALPLRVELLAAIEPNTIVRSLRLREDILARLDEYRSSTLSKLRSPISTFGAG